MNVPYRQIRAAYTDESITVYQAYDAAIAGPAVAAQRFVAPFRMERIQWDPERGVGHDALPYRSIQIGLSGEAVRRYVTEWTLGIADITDRVRELHAAVRAGADVRALLPAERPYPLTGELTETVGAIPAESRISPTEALLETQSVSVSASP
ncbi:DUF4291 family protein [Nonomuraea rosea]